MFLRIPFFEKNWGYNRATVAQSLAKFLCGIWNICSCIFSDVKKIEKIHGFWKIRESTDTVSCKKGTFIYCENHHFSNSFLTPV